MSNDKTLATGDASYTTGHCAHNNRPGGCHLHNLQCGWPSCDRRPAKPSLATVKHGGCVKLGDGLPSLPCTDYNAYSDGTEPLFNAQQMRDYARTALAAQPSPGGQGDALEQALEQAWKYFNVSRAAGEFMWNAALAACAPVRIYGCCAQPEGELHTAECPNMRHLAARQQVCATVKDSLTVGGGQAVGEPVAFRVHYLSGKTGEVIETGKWCDAPVPSFIDESVTLFSGNTQRLELAYSGPPAQAVDLGMPIAMIDQALGRLSTTLDDLQSSPDRRPAVMVAEAIGYLHQALMGIPHG